ncbi:response regulator [Halarsenatibacter silvermanii]|uniref:Stage 0 sporulation protein A homolog n=1 Tax=Halarsenatibacter silvermanii TaxID=321763 RepID=A0A1G9SDY2_9FIRM|nr:response regulator [Halarsenatibacter silvermanii]SDM33683.1 two-component system, chemotaxis family, response regulator CheY [Halarsenatibacter silvermanii]
MSRTVLVTDDAAFMRMTLKNTLSDEGFEVVAEAENGKDAIEKYREHNPDLVTMDITMPEVDGLEATKEILAEDPEAKIVMVSAMGQQKMVIEAIEAGAQDFIVKPFDDARIKEAVNKVFSGSEV